MPRDEATAERLRWRPPTYAYRIAMWVFLTSLSMLFGASLIGYALMRYDGPSAPRHGTIDPPNSLFLSTGVLVLGSVTMSGALAAVRREKQRRFRWLMAASSALALLFLVVQGPALLQLVDQYAVQRAHFPQEASKATGDAKEYLRLIPKSAGSRAGQLYGVVTSMIVLHALHVIGGLLPLSVTTLRAFRGKYDHEVYEGVALCAMYWHFLDVVWIVLFGSFLLLG